jgi:acyl-coenzyme A thioesterase PaaI-like protein
MRNEPTTTDDGEFLSFPADGGCFGCSAENPTGLQMRFRRRGDVITADYVVGERFHGAPGVAHGGIVATMLDEISCAVAMFTREVPVVTGELSVRYRRPCPVEVPVALTARITGAHPRYLVIEADLHHGDELLAHSTGKFFFASTTAP